MAWDFQFLDTFAHYTLSQATTKGKWTMATFSVDGGSDDAYQTVSVGTNTFKTFAGYASQAAKPTGRIVAVRGARNWTYSAYITICGVRDTVTNEWVALQIHDNLGTLRVSSSSGYTKDDSPPQIVIANLEKHNFQLAVWWNSGAAKYDYEVRVDNIPITNLTVTAGPPATGTPGLDQAFLNLGSSTNGIYRMHWYWTSQYSNSGGKFVDGDFLPNVKRGVQYSDADSSLYPGSAAGAEWQSSAGAGQPYYTRLNEALGSEAQYISTTTDPGGSPTDLSRAAYEMANVSSSITAILAVQRTTLLHAEVGSGTVKLFNRYKSDATPANTYLDAAITPLSSPTYQTKAEPLDPRDSTSWSRTKLNTLERGVETQDLT